jgi:hypothetical protein
MFFLSCTTATAYKVINIEGDYGIYYPDFPEIIKDVTPFCLGSVSDPNLLYEFGLFLSKKTKEFGAEACLIGFSEVLPLDFKQQRGSFDEIIAPFFSNSAYKCAQVVQGISKGLMAGGVFPVLSSKYGINDSYIENLKFRKIYPAILLETENYESYRLKSLELPIIDENGERIFNGSMLLKLNWNWFSEIKSVDMLREDILLNSIVQIKKIFLFEDFEIYFTPLKKELSEKTAVFVADPRIIDKDRFKTGYLIHSTDDFILERIRLISNGIYNARGSVNWE